MTRGRSASVSYPIDMLPGSKRALQENPRPALRLLCARSSPPLSAARKMAAVAPAI